MGFYEDKRRAYVDIDKMLEDKTQMEIIYYKIQTKYGFSPNFVKKRVKILKELSAAMQPGSQEPSEKGIKNDQK